MSGYISYYDPDTFSNPRMKEMAIRHNKINGYGTLLPIPSKPTNTTNTTNTTSSTSTTNSIISTVLLSIQYCIISYFNLFSIIQKYITYPRDHILSQGVSPHEKSFILLLNINYLQKVICHIFLYFSLFC